MHALRACFVDLVFTFTREPKTQVLVEIIVSKSTSQLEG